MDDSKNTQSQQPQDETANQGALPEDSASQGAMPEGFQPYAPPQAAEAAPQPGAPQSDAPQSGDGQPCAAPQPGAQPYQPYAQPQQPGAQTPPPGYVPPVPPVQPGGYYGQPGPYAYGQPQPSSGKAIAALVCGILAILFSWTILFGIGLGIAAIILARSAVKEAGKDGKTTGGKICGIVGIAFSVLTLAAVVALGALIGVAYNESRQADHGSYSYSQEDGWQRLDGGGVDSTQLDATEREVGDLAAAELDKLVAQDPAMVQELARELDEEMRDSTEYLVGGQGVSLADAGVDSTALAQWMLEGMTYTIDNVYPYTNGNDADVLATINMRDVALFSAVYHEKLDAAIGTASGLTTEQVTSAVNAAVTGAMAEGTDYTDVSHYIEYENKGGTWTPDEHWYDDLVEHTFEY